jgi:hypothetical protein
MMEILGWLLAGLAALATVGLHYETMRLGTNVILPWGWRRFRDRRAMLLMTLALLVAHVVEIWIFAGGLWLVSLWPHLGALSGAGDAGLESFLYFSAVSYTSLGYGDIVPEGAMRSLAVSEALVGLLMIGWSASFIGLRMERPWRGRQASRNGCSGKPA